MKAWFEVLCEQDSCLRLFVLGFYVTSVESRSKCIEFEGLYLVKSKDNKCNGSDDGKKTNFSGYFC